MSSVRLLIALGLILFAQNATAVCHPCLTTLSIERTVQQASVIAVVSNNDRNSSAYLEAGPEVVNLTVEKLLRGAIDNEYPLTVHSWYGECPFGVRMGVGDHAIVLLQEVTDITTGEWDGTYKLVESGCSQGQLDIRGDTMRLNGKNITIGEFEHEYLR